MRANEILILQNRENEKKINELSRQRDYWKQYKGKLYLHEMAVGSIVDNCRKCKRIIKKDEHIQKLKNWIGEQN